MGSVTAMYARIGSEHDWDAVWLTRELYLVSIKRPGSARPFSDLRDRGEQVSLSRNKMPTTNDCQLSVSVHWSGKIVWAWIGPLEPGAGAVGVYLPHQQGGVQFRDRELHEKYAPLNDPFNREAPPENNEGEVWFEGQRFEARAFGIQRQVKVTLPHHGELLLELWGESPQDSAVWLPRAVAAM